jgi:hypothetical protein
MTSHWDDTLSDMFNTCWKMRNNIPTPNYCSDEQLFRLLNELNEKWCICDNYISSGYSDKIDDDVALDNPYFISWTEHLINKCCYYEDMIDEIEYEISRRTWLK